MPRTTGHTAPEAELRDGSRIAVVGGGPAGSFFSYFALTMAERAGLDIHLDLFEPRDFSVKGPKGCNMCGGIISESLVQALAAEGINLPSSVVQRGIDSYVLHMDVGDVRIATPGEEQRIAAVYRGAGPLRVKDVRWESFDGHLQGLARERGAHIVPHTVDKIEWQDGYPVISGRGLDPARYDLVVMAVGINSTTLKTLAPSVPGYRMPGTTKTFIREYDFGDETTGRVLGSSMHVFLIDVPRLEFAAIIPKGDCTSVCLLGEDIDRELLQSFMGAPEVKRCMPGEWVPANEACGCSPRMNIAPAARPFADRMLFIGDCGVTRLYKDGIGAAYRTAKAAAATAIFQGVSAEHFAAHFAPACGKITTDNRFGKIVFFVTELIKKRRFTRRAIWKLVQHEQDDLRGHARMSTVLWDTFTGSAPYRDIFKRTLHPAFILRLAKELVSAFFFCTFKERKKSGGSTRVEEKAA
jgi:flavin-dependent dehydrogenase